MQIRKKMAEYDIKMKRKWKHCLEQTKEKIEMEKRLRKKHDGKLKSK